MLLQKYLNILRSTLSWKKVLCHSRHRVILKLRLRALKTRRYFKKGVKREWFLNQTHAKRAWFIIYSGHCHRKYHSMFPPSVLLCCSNSPTTTVKELFRCSLVGASYYALSYWHFLSKSHFRNKFALLLPLVLFPVASILTLPCHYTWCCKDMLTRPWKGSQFHFLSSPTSENAFQHCYGGRVP